MDLRVANPKPILLLGESWSAPEVGVHNELFVLGGAKFGVPHHEQELMVQVVEAGTPRAAAQRSPDCELVADRRKLGRQHDGIWLPVLAHDGGQERPHIPQQLRGQRLKSGSNSLDKTCTQHLEGRECVRAIPCQFLLSQLCQRGTGSCRLQPRQHLSAGCPARTASCMWPLNWLHA